MPFVERKDQDLLGAVGLLENPQALQPIDPSFWSETLPAAFRLENTVASFLSGEGEPRRGVQDEGFDPFDHIAGTRYADFAHAFVEADSPEEVALVKSKIDREIGDIETLVASGASGWAAAMMAGILDPLVLLPFGTAVRSVRMGKSAKMLAALPAPLQGGLVTARAAVLGQTTAEALLHTEQEVRTFGESVINVSAAGFLAGVMGAGITKVDQALTKAAVKEVERELGTVAGGADPNVARVTAAEAMADSAGTASNTEIKLKSSFGAARVVAGMRLSPFLRLMVKSRSNKLKQALLDMADSPVLVEGWSPNASVFQQVEGWNTRLGLLSEARTETYARYRERVTGEKAGGRVRSAALRAKDRISGKDLDALSEGEFNIEVSKAMIGGDKHPVPEVQRMARQYREELFNPMLERMMETGRLPETFPDFETVGALSYLTRVYNKNNIIAYSDQFNARMKNWLREIITDDEIDAITKKHTGLGHEEAIELELDQATQDIFDNIVGHSDARLMIAPMKQGKASALKPRALTISDEVLRAPIPDGEGGWVHFLEMDIETISRFYTRTVAPDVELHARFGSVDMHEQIGAIREEYRAVRNAESDPKKKRNLGRQMEKEIEILEAIRDRLRGVYRNPADHAGITALRLARTANVLAQGGGFMLSSVPDLGMVVMRNGLWRTFRTGIVPLVSHFNAVRMSAKELKLFGVGMEMMETRAGAMADMGDEFARNWLERGAQKLTRNFMMWNLLAPWNTMMKRWAGVITQTRMIEAIQDLQLGRISRMDAEDLVQAGISNSMARRIATMLESADGMRSDGPVKWAQTIHWGDLEARKAFAAALRNVVDQTIVTPGIAERPLFMSYELGKTVTQYKAFAVTATQRVMVTGLQRRNAAALNGLLIMLAMGLGVEHAKSRQAGREGPQEPQEMLKAALDRSGTIGIFGDFFNMLERTGMLPFFRGPLSSRYAARNTTSALLGPTVGLGESAITLAIAGGKGEFTQSEMRMGRRLLPWQNLFYFRKLFDAAEEGVNDALGIPKTRSRR